MEKQLSAMTAALAGLFDYAGMFPPAELDIHAAARNFVAYRRGEYAWALGRLVMNATALDTFRDLAGLRLSVVTAPAEIETVARHLVAGLPIEMIEVKAGNRSDVMRIRERVRAGAEIYVEVPLELSDLDVLDAIGNAGACAKLRMGGVVAEAFPSSHAVAAMLKELARRRIPFKATAGLHHPLRSRHPFTYQKDSPAGLMHGFMNLLGAAALVWFGGKADEAMQVLEEKNAGAWRVTKDEIGWRAHGWSAEQMHEVRESFLKSIGSCSFTEPMEDLEALGWL